MRTVGVNIDLLDSTNTVVTSDSFQGVLGAFAISSLASTSLTVGGTYSLTITGTRQTACNYTMGVQMN